VLAKLKQSSDIAASGSPTAAKMSDALESAILHRSLADHFWLAFVDRSAGSNKSVIISCD
jgi:hypothetical protein